MRERLNLTLTSLDNFGILFHGGPGVGKTRLIGDALYTEEKSGPVAYVNIKGQDGWASLSGYPYKSIHAETVDTYDDFIACMLDLERIGLSACGLDSIRDLMRLSTIKTTGTDRPPKASQKENEFSQIYFDFERAVRIFKMSAKRVLTCSTSDRSTDQLSGSVNIVPDLPGRQGNGVASLFDFVGYLSAQTKLGVVRRTLSLQTMTVQVSNTSEISVLTRQRLPRAITSDIVIPEGHGGWKAVLAEFTDHLDPTKKDEKKWK